MAVEEEGTVVELRGPLALVRAVPSAQCAGCAAAGACHGGGSGGEKVVEAVNEAGASPGDRVVMALQSGALLKAAFRVYVIPVLGILAGAGAAQVAVEVLRGGQGAGAAAGIGGAAGAVLALLAQRLHSRRPGGAGTLRPRVVRIL